MGGLGAPELILIVLIVLILFGAGKLPQVFGSLGKAVREFREASEDKDKTETPANPPASTTPIQPAAPSSEQVPPPPGPPPASPS